MLVPVLGNVAEIAVALADGGVGDILPAERHGAALGPLQSCEAIDQLCLAVSVNTGHAHDLPGTDVKADTVHGVAPVAGAGGHRQPLHMEHRLLGLSRGLDHLQLHRAPHHHVGKGLLIRVLGLHRTDIFSLAQDGDPVRHGHDLIELVGDEENGLALFGKLPHGRHQLFDLLGGQDSGGFVENQNLVVPVEHLEDLHPLLHADGDVLHLGIQIHLHPVTFGEVLHLFPGGLSLQKAQLCGLRAQNDIVQHSEYIDQLEMLMDHPDPQRRRIIGAVDLDLFPVLLDDTRLRLV